MKHTAFYDWYMRSESWKDKRQERLKIDDYKCAMCGRPLQRTRNGLQIHHVSYLSLGNENVYSDLVTLCAGCHKKIHAFQNRIVSPYDKRLEKRC